MMEKRLLRRLFGIKEEEVTEHWRKLNNEEPHNLEPSPSIVGMTESIEMWCEWQIAYM
jgi:hypothetical protein